MRADDYELQLYTKCNQQSMSLQDSRL